MKQRVFIMWGITFLVMAVTAAAAVPPMINYQGRVTDAAGQPISATTSMTFTIYSDADGLSPVWSETQASVVVNDGLFTVLLGSVTPLGAGILNGDQRWLGVQVGAEPATTQLIPIVSVAYSYRALWCDSAQHAPAAANGWVDDGNIVRLATATDSVGIGTTSPYTKFQVGLGPSTHLIAQIEGLTAIRTNGPGQPTTLRLANLNGTANSGVSFDLDGLNSSAMQKEAARISGYLTDQTPLHEKTALTFATGDYADDGLAERVRIDADGNVGFGTTSPTEKLDADGTARLRGINGGSGTEVVVDENGVLFKSTSSERYKNNIRSLESNPEGLTALRPVKFQWRTTGKQDIGLIAEEVAKAVPELVIYDSENRPDGVKYDKLTLYLLQLAQAQQKRIETLEERLSSLESRK